MRPMRERVMQFDAGWWARTFIDELCEREAAPHAPADVNAARQRLSAAVAANRPVAMFLDYDGTLREIEREASAAKPNAAVRSALDLLDDAASRDPGARGASGQHPHLDVTIISGRHEELEAARPAVPRARRPLIVTSRCGCCPEAPRA